MQSNKGGRRLPQLARGICAAIAAAACIVLAMPGNAASQPAYVGNGGLVGPHQPGTSVTASLPASPTVGDLLVLQVGVGDPVTFSISPPSVWTSLGTQSYAGYTTAVYWAVYTAGMTAPTVSWTGQAIATATVSEFTGVASSPIGAVGTISFNNYGDHTSAAVTTTNANSLVLLSDIAADLPNLTTPPNWTQALALNWRGGSQTLDYEAIAASGTSPGATSSAGASTAWFTQQFEVLAAPGASSPTASLTANPTSITAGQSSTLSWSSANATSCTGTGFLTGNAVSGSVSVAPATTATYAVSCTNGSASASANATVTVTAPAPTASLTANPASITAGQSSTLSWSSTNATSCTGNGFLTGNSVTGSVSVTPATTTTYIVTCTNGSASASTSATVTVTGTTPTATLTANPASITSGQSSTLTWSSTNATSCTGTGFSTGNAVSGSVSVTPSTTASYSVNCTNGSTSASASATVTVLGAPTLTVLHSFTFSDGSHPLAGLIFDKSGNLYSTTIYGSTFGDGEVFKLAPPATVGGAWTETIFHAFSGTDGAYPYYGAKPIFDSNGNLYGTTSQGGTSNVGTVFKLSPAGTETVLYSFTGGADGNQPGAGLVFDSSGNLYGTTPYGGRFGSGVVFKLSPAGTETVLYSFTGGADGGNPFSPLILDSKGNLYGTASAGGASYSGVVFKVAPGGTETVLYSFTGAADGGAPYAGLVFDSNGNLYGTAFYGGVSNAGTVFELSPPAVAGGAWTENVLHSFTYADGAGPYFGTGLLFDANKNLYGITSTGGATDAGVVFKLSPGGTETVLYNFRSGGGHPKSIDLLADVNGNLYGTTDEDGTLGYGMVFELTGTGFVTAPQSP
jgi:uncharacterized repeat protein (TIGR03803 family)